MLAFVTATALGVGAFIGLLGGGGSILAVPLLVHGAGLPVPEAVAGGLVLVGSAALAATAGYLRAGHVDGAAVASFGTVGIVGSYAGARLAAHVDPRVQLALFSLLMLVVGLSMLAPARPTEPVRAGRARLALVALGVGLLTGLLGAGGGFVLVPAMTRFVGLPMRRAIGSSVAVLAITATGAVAGHLEHVALPAGTWALPALAAALAAVIGAALAHLVPDRGLRRAFGVFVLALAVLQWFAR